MPGSLNADQTGWDVPRVWQALTGNKTRVAGLISSILEAIDRSTRLHTRIANPTTTTLTSIPCDNGILLCRYKGQSSKWLMHCPNWWRLNMEGAYHWKAWCQIAVQKWSGWAAQAARCCIMMRPSAVPYHISGLLPLKGLWWANLGCCCCCFAAVSVAWQNYCCPNAAATCCYCLINSAAVVLSSPMIQCRCCCCCCSGLARHCDIQSHNQLVVHEKSCPGGCHWFERLVAARCLSHVCSRCNTLKDSILDLGSLQSS